MALRARMHPRNIYRTPPNFKQLAIDFPEFRNYVKQELSGRVTLDYNDRTAVMELTRLLLLKDFDLRVEINESRLIPRVPLCLNYILWIEDLLTALSQDEVRGIDIGTGSVCIYSLLGATKGWKMLATEVDKVSFENASENVKRNNLSDKISVKYVEDPNLILENVIDDTVTYDFCMCNPPFFDENERPVNRTRRRKMLETTASYVQTDVCTRGGEVEFIKKLLDESKKLGEKVKIYTTLVGKRSDFTDLRKQIAKINPVSVAETEFCQGNTIRWGMAWTFLNLNLKEVQNSKSEADKKTKYLTYMMPKEDCSLKEGYERVKKILEILKISHTREEISNGFILTAKAYENTWSHQRRRNRMKKRVVNQATPDTGQGKEDASEQTNDEQDDSSSNQEVPQKKIKLSESDNEKTEEAQDLGKTVLVEFHLSMTEEGDDVSLKLSWVLGSKEAVHQIFQYIKNNWSKVAKSNDNNEEKE